MNYEQIVLATPAYLSGSIASGATQICITSGVLWPQNQSGTFRVVIDKEIKRLYGNISGSLVYNIAQGGAENTFETPHWDRAGVFHVLTPQGIKNLVGGVNPQTGTSYTIGSADVNALVTLANLSGIAVTVPQATSGDTSSFGPHFVTTVFNLLGSGSITPSTSLINSGTSLAINSGQAATIWSDGINYWATLNTGGGGGGTTLASGSVQSGNTASRS